MQTAILIALFLVFLLENYIVYRLRRVAHNDADIKQNRQKEYESEKGKNLATKEDIRDITKQIEDIRNVVALSNQRRFDQKVEQEKLLISILYDANSIAYAQNKLILYMYDQTSRVRLDRLVEFVSDTMAKFYHECNLAEATIEETSLPHMIQQLGAAVSALGTELNVNATNAANLIEQFKNEFEYSTRTDIDLQTIQSMAIQSQLTKKKLIDLRDKPLEAKGQLRQAIDEYRLWLKDLYGRDFFSF